MTDKQPEPESPATVLAIQAALAKLKDRARLVAMLMAAALTGFVLLLAGEGRPVWLVTLIGFFGVILLAMLIALVWFWLHVFAGSSRKKHPDARN